MLVKASIDVGAWWLAASILFAGLLTTIALVRMFAFSFWRDAPAEREAGTDEDIDAPGPGSAVVWTVTALAAMSVIAGLYPEPFVAVANLASDQLLNPSAYIDAVFPTTAELGTATGGVQ